MNRVSCRVVGVGRHIAMVGTLLLLVVAGGLGAEPLTALSGDDVFGAKKDHVLSAGQKRRSWQYRFEIPDEVQSEGAHWTRTLRTTGRLVVLEEALARDAYYVRVTLQGETAENREGGLHVWLKQRQSPVPAKRPGAPSVSFVANPLQPEFSWYDPRETIALSLYDRPSGHLLHQEVLSSRKTFSLTGVRLQVGGQYLLIATESDAWGRYSPATNLAWTITTVPATCPVCRGDGIGWENHENPATGATPPVCRECQGRGKIDQPVFRRDRFAAQ